MYLAARECLKDKGKLYMYRSAEVRWFFQDELPGDVRQ